MIAILSWLTGCQSVSRARDFINVSKLSPPYRVVVYESGQPASNRIVEPGSQEERIFTRWIQAHSEGWRRNLVNYAPARRIEGSDFNLNFTGGVCVPNYQAGPEHRVQVSRPIDGEDARVPASRAMTATGKNEHSVRKSTTS